MVDWGFGAKKIEGQPEAKKSGGGLFSKKENTKHLMDSIGNFSTQVNSLSRRTRVVEERIGSAGRRIQLTEQNILSHMKKLNSDIRTINDDILSMKKETEKIRNTIDIIIKELKLSARKEDVNVLQRYINLWDPVKFVTQNEVEAIIERALKSKNL